MRLFGKVDGNIDKNDRPLFMGGIFTRRFHDEFPTLSRGASFQNFTQDSAVDSTIRSEFADGSVLTRARYTTTLKSFNFGYSFITAADKGLLEDLQTSLKIGAATFYYTYPSDDTELELRLTAPMKFQVEPRNFNYWNVRLNTAQV